MLVKVVAGAVALFTVVVAGIVVGEVLGEQLDDPPAAPDATPVGELSIPFGESDEENEGADPESGAEAAASPEEPAATASDGGGDASTPDLAELPEGCVDEFQPGELIPLFAIGEVVGFGPSARYVVLASCAGPRALAFHIGAERLSDPAYVDPGGRVVDDGGCFYHHSRRDALGVYLASLATGGSLDIPAALVEPGVIPDVFEAVFRPRHGETLSVADDGFTRGTYTVGPPEGGRGGEQWLFESSGRLSYSAYSISVTTIEGAPPGFALAFGVVTATWHGDAIEDFSGEEASGTVKFTCGYAYLRDVELLD